MRFRPGVARAAGPPSAVPALHTPAYVGRVPRSGPGKPGFARWLGNGALLVALWGHPVSAQVDLTGSWRQLSRNEDGSGMVGDAAGLPISASNRWRSDSWSPED